MPQPAVTLPGPADRPGEPATLYLHIPFCEAKCGYCSFNSRPAAAGELDAYLAGLKVEAERLAASPQVRGRRFASVFIGGGTPTIYGGEELAGLIAHCRKLFEIVNGAEISVEANPNTVSVAKLEQLRAAGVSRLSFGVQSFDDQLLARLGRRHTAAQAEAAVAMARRAGFDNLSLDLIYGLPGQQLATWQHSLERGLALEPQHLSLYELMVEPGSRFFTEQQAGGLKLPDDDTVAAMLEEAVAQLASHGYERYEISNYARPGYRCRHNIHYWQNRSYLGLGAGAVSCLDGLRLTNCSSPQVYLARIRQGLPAWSGGEALARAARLRETVIMGLRMTAGVELAELADRFGLDVEAYYGPLLAKLRQQGLLTTDNDHLRLTGRGLAVANQVLSELV